MEKSFFFFLGIIHFLHAHHSNDDVQKKVKKFKNHESICQDENKKWWFYALKMFIESNRSRTNQFMSIFSSEWNVRVVFTWCCGPFSCAYRLCKWMNERKFEIRFIYSFYCIWILWNFPFVFFFFLLLLALYVCVRTTCIQSNLYRFKVFRKFLYIFGHFVFWPLFCTLLYLILSSTI